MPFTVFGASHLDHARVAGVLFPNPYLVTELLGRPFALSPKRAKGFYI